MPCNTSNNGGTTFDDVFKTECIKLKRFLIPLVKETFGVDCEDVDSSDIQRMAQEYHLLSMVDEDASEIQERDLDNCIKINDRIYHFECQSTEDGDILFRIAEYNVLVAFENASNNRKEKTICIDLPSSALLKLRGGETNKNKFSHMYIEYRYGE